MVWSHRYFLSWGVLLKFCERIAVPVRKSGASQNFDAINSY